MSYKTSALCIAALAAAVLLGSAPLTPWAASAASAQTDASGTKQGVSTNDIRRLQRLLKLLAHQSPARFATVDPGPVDGTLGKATVIAITNFQRIIGVKEQPAVTPDLFAQILTAHAREPLPMPDAKSALKDACPAGSATDACAKAERAGARADRARHAEGVPHGPGRPAEAARFAQIASLRSKEGLRQEWTRVRQAGGGLLDGREPRVETADLGERGSYYRLMIGPFAGFKDAESFCLALRKKGRGCLVRKRTQDQIDATEKLAVAAAAPAETPAVARIPKQEPADAAPAETPPVARIPKQEPADAAPAETPPGKSAAEAVAATAAAAAETSAPMATETLASPVTPAPITPAPVTPVPVTPVEVGKPVPPAAGAATPGDEAAQPPQPAGTASDAVREEEKVARPAAVAQAPLAAVADTAVRADKAAPAPVAPATALPHWLGSLDRNSVQTFIGPGVAAGAGACFGLLVLVWRERRRRNLMLEAIPSEGWFDERAHEFDLQEDEQAPRDVLEELRTQFENPELQACRRIRDEFLDRAIGRSEPPPGNAASSETSMLVNRKLNQLLATDTAQYKSIFLNWVFLNHVAAMVERAGYTLKRLDPRIQREFRLLGSYFKIHLLELEARHHVRDRLPNVFASLRHQEH